MSNHRLTLLKNGLSSGTAKFIQTMLGFVTIPMMIRHFGAAGYGVFITINTVASYFTPADAGLGAHAVSEAAASVDQRHAAALVGRAAWLAGIVAIVIFVAFSGLLWVAPPTWLHSLFETNPSGNRVLLQLAVGFVLASVPLVLVQKLPFSQNKDYWNQSTLVLLAVANAGIVAACCLGKASLFILILGQGIANISILCGSLLLYYRKHDLEFPERPNLSWSEATSLLRAGAPFLSVQVLSIIGQYTDIVIIATSADERAVAHYYLYQRIFLLAQLAQYFVAPLWPIFARAAATGDAEQALRSMRRYTLVLFLLSALASGLLALLLQPLLHFWLGKGIDYQPGLALAFAISSPLNVCMGVASMFMLTKQKIAINTRLFFVATILSVVVRLVATRYWGSIGLALSGALIWFVCYSLPILLGLNVFGPRIRSAGQAER